MMDESQYVRPSGNDIKEDPWQTHGSISDGDHFIDQKNDDHFGDDDDDDNDNDQFFDAENNIEYTDNDPLEDSKKLKDDDPLEDPRKIKDDKSLENPEKGKHDEPFENPEKGKDDVPQELKKVQKDNPLKDSFKDSLKEPQKYDNKPAISARLKDKKEDINIDKQFEHVNENFKSIHSMIKNTFERDEVKGALQDVKRNSKIMSSEEGKSNTVSGDVKFHYRVDVADQHKAREDRCSTYQEEDIFYHKDWQPMPSEDNGKEKTVHLVKLVNGSGEYEKVANMFIKGQPERGRIIVKIERIQNPHLYQQFMVRKQKMDKDNPKGNNERQLFHGTKAENVNDINARGFNRNFCGENVGALYGDGVYFTTDASYAKSFTRPNANGKRHMYIARVLIGRYTKGQKGMKVPPKDPNRPGMSFDSVANFYYRDSQKASIFVVFCDWQCYPEYLITFQ